MFLSGVLIVLFLAGCWLYSLTDAALTPASQFPGLRKHVWIAFIAATFILGAIAWGIARYLTRRTRAINLFLAAEALARHPASRSRQDDPSYQVIPIGPDDDQDFLQMLDRLIAGASDLDELSTASYRQRVIDSELSTASYRQRVIDSHSAVAAGQRYEPGLDARHERPGGGSSPWPRSSSRPRTSACR